MEFIIKSSLSYLISLSFLTRSACLSVFLPLFCVIFISSVFWGCVKASSVDLMPNLLLCLIARLRISPPVIQFNYSETRSAAVELRRSTSWDGFSPTRDVAGFWNQLLLLTLGRFQLSNMTVFALSKQNESRMDFAQFWWTRWRAKDTLSLWILLLQYAITLVK